MAKATKLPSGNWRCKAYYTDEYGQYKSKSFTADSKVKAEYMADEFLLIRKHSAMPENKTLGELADRYIDTQTNILSPSTIRGYRSIRRNALTLITDIRIGLLTTELYQRAINEYAKNHSPKSVKSAHRFYHSVLTTNKITVADKVTLPAKVKHETQIPSISEMVTFLERIKGTRLYLYCILAVYLGLRKSEAIALEWTDINFSAGTVHINKARVRDDAGRYVLKSTKTYESTRTIRMPQLLIDALESISDRDGLIIKDSPKALETLYQRKKKQLDFPYNYHALRHFNASVMLLSGLPNKYAQKRMGHATEDMLTKVYQHTFNSADSEFDDVLDAFFSKNIPIKTDE